MAFQTRSRDPLFDEATQAALERRAWELAGLALLGVAAVLGLALASYAPTDPSFLGTSSAVPQNWLGTFGAYLAAPFTVILGGGAWALVAVCTGWGLRFVLHRGEDRAFGRLVFAPFWVAVASVYGATVPPGPGWTHSFGLGGLFGDTALGVILGLMPLPPAAGLLVSAVALALGLVALGLFVLGATRAEIRGLGRFLGLGVLFAFDRLVRGAHSRAADAKARVAARAEARAERRAARAAPAARRDAVRGETDLFGQDPDDDAVFDDDDDTPDIALPPQPSLGARVARGLGRPQPRLEARADALPDTDLQDPDEDDDDLPPDPERGARVQAKITDAIRLRLRSERAARARARQEPTLRAEPPLTGAVPDAERQATPSQTIDDTADDDADGAAWNALEQAQDRTSGETPAAPRIPRYEPTRPVVQHPVARRAAPSSRARAEAQPALGFDPATDSAYDPPPLSLLRDPATVERLYLSDEALEENARMLESVLEDYGVKGDIVSVRPGPVVTMYELEPAPGLKASRVIGLADDIARSMSALSARVSTVPGRSVIGIELPNDNREMVLLREILSARDFGDSKLRLPLALGKDIGGESVVANLAKMPHLLIAGTTGSGKSVAINTMILSLLYKLTPEECRLIMIDPKMLELSVYDDIPHLLSPVVTDPKKAVVALKWVVAEMEDRYRKMSKMGVRNIEGYNGKVRATLEKGEMFSRTVQTGFDDDTGDPVFETEEFEPQTLPYIVVIVDEMADLMMVAGKEIEACIQRLAQMARASGIHLIMATQRPSVDVITGTIKANFPTRISFQVTSKIDSRTILGEQGAEQLLGMGDMLYMAGGGRITRIHGPFVSDEEVEEVVNHLKSQGVPHYVGGVVDGPEDEKANQIDEVLGLGGNTGGEDALYDQAVQVVINDRKCSTSYIQRKLAIGYNKAARLVEQMEDAGLVSPANHVGKREVLVPERD
jgi:S-DNA-T family DNA segregation ATPase FtsK/SpoIIIE